MGIVRAYQKGTLKTPPPLEVQRAASSMKKKDVKDFASTDHKGLPEKKVKKESFNEDYVKELEDGLVKMDYPTYDEVDKLMCKIAKENDIDTTTLHMAFKTKHLMVPDDWAKKKMFEPVMIPKTPQITGDVDEAVNAAQQAAIAISKRKRLEDLKVAKKKKLRKLRKEEYISELSSKTLNSYKDKVAAQIEKRLDGLNMANRKLEAKKVEKLPPPMKRERLGIVKNETGKTGGNVIDAKDRFKKENYEPVISEKCWKGYEKKGMKTMFGKRYPNCVKKKRTNESVETINELDTGPEGLVQRAFDKAKQNFRDAKTDSQRGKAEAHKKSFSSYAVRKRRQGGNTPEINQFGKKKSLDVEIPVIPEEQDPEGMKLSDVQRIKRQKQLSDAAKKAPEVKNKIVPIKTSTTEEVIHEDDMKGMSVKSGHKRPTKSGAGMTAKGVAAYRRRNPGSKLKTAVTGKVKKGSKDAKRRKSYCARSAGQMKKFPKAAKDPNSRLRQARRRWKC